MKKIIITSFAVFILLSGCSLDSVPTRTMCPGPEIDRGNVKVYIYRNGDNKGELIDDRCPEDLPVCAQFSSDHVYHGNYYCMVDCLKQYCENCEGGQSLGQCNGHCIQPGEVCNATPKCNENECKDEHTRIVCSEDKQSIREEVCRDNEKCSNGECVDADAPVVIPECTANTVKCSDDYLSTITCNENGIWNEAEPCKEGEKCDITKTLCVPEQDATLCLEGEINCNVSLTDGDENIAFSNGSVVYYDCLDGKWSEEYTHCPENQICSQEEHGCIDNPNPCMADAILCMDEKNYYLCDVATGLWTKETNSCEGDLVCDKYSSQCVTEIVNECESDEIRCADNAGYNTCVEGHWSTETTLCGEGKYCDVNNNVCQEGCSENTYQCSEDKLSRLKCESGIWIEDEKCKDNELCEMGACTETECTPGTAYCSETDDSAAIYRCTQDGKKGELISYCESLACLDDGSGCIVCKDGDVQCTESGMFQICMNNRWENKADCGTAEACSTESGKYGCNCIVNRLQCSLDKSLVMKCVAKSDNPLNIKYNTWEINVNCGEANKCVESSSPYCQCTSTYYSSKEFMCFGQLLQYCSSNRIYSYKVCAENEICDVDNKRCACHEGEYRCNSAAKSNARQFCQNGNWTSKPCASTSTCIDNGLCVLTKDICAENSLVCNKNVIMKCTGGVFLESKKCNKTEMCVVNQGMSGYSAECTPITQECQPYQTNQKRCYNSTIQECQDNQWHDFETCTDGFICVETATGSAGARKTTAECKPKNCENYTFTCNNDVIQYCIDNEFHNYGDCGEVGMKCIDGMCVFK